MWGSVWIILATIFIKTSKSSPSLIEIKTLIDMHDRMRSLAINTDESVFTPGALDLVLGNSLLDVWFDSQTEANETQLLAYSRSCSRVLIDAIFKDFKSRKFGTPQVGEDLLRQKKILELEIGKKSRRIDAIERFLSQKQEKLARLEGIYLPLQRRFQTAFLFMQKAMHREEGTFRPIENLADKVNQVWILAKRLAECPEEEIEQASAALIDFVENIQSEGNFNGLRMFDLVQSVQLNLFDHSRLRSKFRKTKKRVDTDTELLSYLKAHRDDLKQQFAILDSFL